MTKNELIDKLSDSEAVKLLESGNFEGTRYWVEKGLSTWSLKKLKEAWKDYGKEDYETYIERG